MITTLISFLGGSVFRMLNGATRLAQSLCFGVCIRRFFQRVEQTKIFALSVITFAFSHVLPSANIEANPKNSCLVIGPGHTKVLQIGFVINATKVLEGIIRLISINVVNAFSRPLSSYEKYRAPVGVILSPGYGNLDVPVGFHPTSHISSFCGSMAYSAGEYPRLQVVIQEFLQSLGGKIGISHDDSLIVRLVRSRVRFAVVHGFAHFKGGCHV